MLLAKYVMAVQVHAKVDAKQVVKLDVLVHAKLVMVDVKVILVIKLMTITAIQDKVVVIHLEQIHHAQVEDMMENKI